MGSFFFFFNLLYPSKFPFVFDFRSGSARRLDKRNPERQKIHSCNLARCTIIFWIWSQPSQRAGYKHKAIKLCHLRKCLVPAGKPRIGVCLSSFYVRPEGVISVLQSPSFQLPQVPPGLLSVRPRSEPTWSTVGSSDDGLMVQEGKGRS